MASLVDAGGRPHRACSATEASWLLASAASAAWLARELLRVTFVVTARRSFPCSPTTGLICCLDLRGRRIAWATDDGARIPAAATPRSRVRRHVPRDAQEQTPSSLDGTTPRWSPSPPYRVSLTDSGTGRMALPRRPSRGFTPTNLGPRFAHATRAAAARCLPRELAAGTARCGLPHARRRSSGFESWSGPRFLRVPVLIRQRSVIARPGPDPAQFVGEGAMMNAIELSSSRGGAVETVETAGRTGSLIQVARQRSIVAFSTPLRG